jgi:HD superfamily phosphohydrolase
MPKWGLTEDQRRSEPWGIPEAWLRPGKTITDPVHGDIHVNRLEQAVLDTPPMQRLRRVRQLGTTHLVYPAATHSRFSHALGALRAAQDLLDAVIDNRSRPQPADDFFSEWSTAIPPEGVPLSEFDTEFARVTVLVRLGALLHDMNHVPFGHTIEDDLEVLESHDENLDRLNHQLNQFPEELRSLLSRSDPSLESEVRKFIVSKDEDGNNFEDQNFLYPFAADIVGNTICADLIDYLGRDHLFTGLPIALGTRFRDEFYVNPSSEVHFPKKMVIRVTREGHERHDVISELLKYLRYRYELSERALAHHAKLAADAMIGKLLEMRSDWLWAQTAAERQPLVAALHRKDISTFRESVNNIGGEALVDEITAAAEAQLEADFLRFGDDGLLEHLRDWGEDAGDDGRRAAVGKLALDVLDRRLYKRIGRADAAEDIALSDRLYRDYGKRSPRRELEEQAARWSGLEERWKVVVWLPSPKMRVKVAQVPVNYQGRVNHLDKIVPERVKDIYDAHRSLWGVSVYTHADVTALQESRLLAYLSHRLGIRFLDRRGSETPDVFDLVLDEVLAESDSNELRLEMRRELPREVAAHGGGDPTFDDWVARAGVLKAAKA